MAPKELLAAAVAPGPYTAWALARRRSTICSELRRHRILFTVAWCWFLVHVVRKVS